MCKHYGYNINRKCYYILNCQPFIGIINLSKSDLFCLVQMSHAPLPLMPGCYSMCLRHITLYQWIAARHKESCLAGPFPHPRTTTSKNNMLWKLTNNWWSGHQHTPIPSNYSKVNIAENWFYFMYKAVYITQVWSSSSVKTELMVISYKKKWKKKQLLYFVYEWHLLVCKRLGAREVKEMYLLQLWLDDRYTIFHSVSARLGSHWVWNTSVGKYYEINMVCNTNDIANIENYNVQGCLALIWDDYFVFKGLSFIW